MTCHSHHRNWGTHEKHTHASVPCKAMETHGAERGPLSVWAHATLHRPSLALCLSLSSATGDDRICSHAFSSEQNKRTRRHGYTCCSSCAPNWPSYRFAFLHVTDLHLCFSHTLHMPAQKPWPLRTLTYSWCKIQIIVIIKYKWHN